MSPKTKLITQYIAVLNNLYRKYLQLFQNKKVGVFVSGGIDSSLIAYFTSQYFKNINLLTLHSKDALDLNYAKTLNQFLKQKLFLVEFNQQKIKEITPQVIKILSENNIEKNPTQISLACAFFILCQKAKEKGIDIIFTGQGPDILLAGYHMYQKIPLSKLNEKIKNDLPLLEIDKKRDNAVALYFNIQLVNPYLEKKFIDFALKIPPEFKINKIGEEIFEKYLSRKVGEYLKIPQEIILRHKKALQYSTKIRKFFPGSVLS
jgi:asparagine synthase (glutamine-hydrolysing)